jgi:hypothetical protein
MDTINEGFAIYASKGGPKKKGQHGNAPQSLFNKLEEISEMLRGFRFSHHSILLGLS